MKPLQAAPLTNEDLDIWGWVQSKRRAHLWHLSAHCDRRDAALMLSLREARIRFTAAGYDHGLLAHNGVIRDMTGRTEPGEEYYGGVPLPRLNITGCA